MKHVVSPFVKLRENKWLVSGLGTPSWQTWEERTGFVISLNLLIICSEYGGHTGFLTQTATRMWGKNTFIYAIPYLVLKEFI